MTNVGLGKYSSAVDFDLSFADRQAMRVLEEKLQDVLMALECTANTIQGLLKLQRVSQKLALGLKASSSGKITCSRSETSDVLQQNLIAVQLHRKQAENLLERMKSNTTLVS